MNNQNSKFQNLTLMDSIRMRMKEIKDKLVELRNMAGKIIIPFLPFSMDQLGRNYDKMVSTVSSLANVGISYYMYKVYRSIPSSSSLGLIMPKYASLVLSMTFALSEIFYRETLVVSANKLGTFNANNNSNPNVNTPNAGMNFNPTGFKFGMNNHTPNANFFKNFSNGSSNFHNNGNPKKLTRVK